MDIKRSSGKIEKLRSTALRLINVHPEAESMESVLTVDIGPSSITVYCSSQPEPRQFAGRNDLTPMELVDLIAENTYDWSFDAVSIAFPGSVGSDGPLAEPQGLGSGWIGFNFTGALGCPTKIMNDAVMQALGNYEGGRLLFIGLRPGLRSALISDAVVLPLELGHLYYRKDKNLDQVLSECSREKIGKRRWRRIINQTAASLMQTFQADYVVIGGESAGLIKELPPGVRVSSMKSTAAGGLKLWQALMPCNLAL